MGGTTESRRLGARALATSEASSSDSSLFGLSKRPVLGVGATVFVRAVEGPTKMVGNV